MAWTNLSFAYGSVLTSAQMNNLFADLTALANGDTGAPPIQGAALDTNAKAVVHSETDNTLQNLTASYATYISEVLTVTNGSTINVLAAINVQSSNTTPHNISFRAVVNDGTATAVFEITDSIESGSGEEAKMALVGAGSIVVNSTSVTVTVQASGSTGDDILSGSLFVVEELAA